MNEIDRFINSENIARFANHLLAGNHDAGQSRTVRQLLLEEEHRFGSYSAQLELAQRFISESADRINQQKELIARQESNGGDTGEANRYLDILIDLQDLFKEFHRSAAAALDRNRS